MSKDTIKSLDTRQQCREKLPIFFGSNDNYLHGLRECLANSTDEINENFLKGSIIVKLHEDDKTVTIFDTGRGMPIMSKTGDKYNYQLLFETLFAGTNYDNHETGKITTGTNGVGLCVLNHTSILFEVVSCNNGTQAKITYKDGGRLEEKEKIKTEVPSFTKITFTLDPEVYTNIVYNIDEIKEIVKRVAAVNHKITYKVIYKKEETVYKYNSINHYFKEEKVNNSTDILPMKEVKYEDANELNYVQIALAGSPEAQFQETYLNGTYLPEQGTIYDGIINGAKLFFNKYSKDNGLYNKNEKAINNKDVEGALNFICYFRSTKVSFSNQTKFSTTKKLYKDIAQKYIQTTLEVLTAEQPMEISTLANQILVNKRISEKANQSLEKLKKKLQGEVNNITNKIKAFTDCKNKKGGQLFIAEGQSAAGSIVLSRNSEWQAVFALRGKLLNILKTDINKIFDNEEIKNLVSILGCGVELKNKNASLFDKSKLKFNDIIIATDADPDGLHIQALVLTALYIIAPTLIKDGHVYILDTPLFEIRDLKTDEMHYAYTEQQKEEILSKLSKYRISRNKGLGEVDADTMAVCIDMKQGTKRQVQWTQAEEIAKNFETFMGNDLDSRREYIRQNLHKYIDIEE
jgi:DNA gyrase subunit B